MRLLLRKPSLSGGNWELWKLCTSRDRRFGKRVRTLGFKVQRFRVCGGEVPFAHESCPSCNFKSLTESLDEPIVHVQL